MSKTMIILSGQHSILVWSLHTSFYGQIISQPRVGWVRSPGFSLQPRQPCFALGKPSNIADPQSHISEIIALTTRMIMGIIIGHSFTVLEAQLQHLGMPSHFSCVQCFATLLTVAHQAPLSMRFSRQEYWNGLPFIFIASLGSKYYNDLFYIQVIKKERVEKTCLRAPSY